MGKLALVVEKLEDVAEPLRAAYVERDGKFHLDADVPDVGALEAAAAEEREKREAAEALMRKARQEADRLKNAKKASDAGLTEEQLKQLRADVRAEVDAEYAPKLSEADRIKAQNRTLLLDGAVKKMAVAAGILPAKLDDFWKLRGDEFDLTDDGKPMVKGKPGTTPEKHLEALKKLNPEWVAGTKAAGSGALGGAGGAGGAGLTYEDIHKNPEAALARIDEEAA